MLIDQSPSSTLKLKFLILHGIGQQSNQNCRQRQEQEHEQEQGKLHCMLHHGDHTLCTTLTLECRFRFTNRKIESTDNSPSTTVVDFSPLSSAHRHRWAIEVGLLPQSQPALSNNPLLMAGNQDTAPIEADVSECPCGLAAISSQETKPMSSTDTPSLKLGISRRRGRDRQHSIRSHVVDLLRHELSV